MAEADLNHGDDPKNRVNESWSFGNLLRFGSMTSSSNKVSNKDTASSEAVGGFSSLFKYDGTVCLLHAIKCRDTPISMGLVQTVP